MEIFKNKRTADTLQLIKFVFVYTCLFFTAILIVTYKHILTGRTFIWVNDPWWQHYKAYTYIISYYKKIIINLIYSHSLNVPLWDMTIGEGSDIINAFCYYGLTDPFNIVGLMIPSKHILLSFHIVIISKMFFSGISFAYMCSIILSNKYKNKASIIICSVLYAFCAWNIYNMRRHHMFMNALVFVPLVIAGIEKILNNIKTVLISIGVFFIAISNLYYLYVSALIIGIYTVTRVLFISNMLVKIKIMIILNVVLLSLFGVLISSFISLPSVYYFLNDARKKVHFDILFLYPKEYYIEFFKNLIVTTKNSFWLICGYGVISIVALIQLFVSKKRYTEKMLFFISIIFMLFPIFGQMLNAFKYVSNKWAVSILIHFILCNFANQTYEKISNILYKKIFISLFLFLAFGTILLNSNVLNSTKIDNNYMNCAKIEDVNNWILHDEAEALKEYKTKINDTAFSRYDTDYEDWNNGFLKEMHNLSYYWTLSNKYLVEFKQAFYNRESFLHAFTNYDNRIILDALSSVKYFVHDKNRKGKINNSKFVGEKGNYEIYEKKSFLNISYVYDKFIKNKDFDKLNIGEKEIMLLNACVLNNDANTRFMNTNNFDFSKSVILYQNNNVHFKATKENNYINFLIDKSKLNNEEYEYRLVFHNLNYFGEKESTNLSIFGDNNYLNNIVYHNKTHQHYSNIHNFAANLKKDSIDNITIFFDEEGIYTCDSIYIVALPVNYINELIIKLNENVINNITVNKDGLNGEVYVKRDGALVFSIPYSKFWKIYLDGKEVEYFNVNLKNVGIYISKGKKNVKIVYKNTAFYMGCIISIIVLVIFVVMLMLRKLNKFGRKY